MSGRVTEHETPQPMTDEQMLEIEGLIQAGELYDENTLLDIAEDLIATVRAARTEVARWKVRGDTLIAVMRGQGLTVREHGDGQEHWLTILPAGCKCERTVGDSPCPLHTLGVGDDVG